MKDDSHMLPQANKLIIKYFAVEKHAILSTIHGTIAGYSREHGFLWKFR
jgi:hypothetical protein